MTASLGFVLTISLPLNNKLCHHWRAFSYPRSLGTEGPGERAAEPERQTGRVLAHPTSGIYRRETEGSLGRKSVPYPLRPERRQFALPGISPAPSPWVSSCGR